MKNNSKILVKSTGRLPRVILWSILRNPVKTCFSFSPVCILRVKFAHTTTISARVCGPILCLVPFTLWLGVRQEPILPTRRVFCEPLSRFHSPRTARTAYWQFPASRILQLKKVSDSTTRRVLIQSPVTVVSAGEPPSGPSHLLAPLLFW